MNFEYNEVTEIAKLLLDDKVILYPTDTVWGMGCLVNNVAGIDRITQLKNRTPDKSFIILVNSVQMLKHYVVGIHPRIETLLSYHSQPLTIIYPKAKNLPHNVIVQDGSIAIRICGDPFCNQLIGQVNQAIISTSANKTGEPTPLNFNQISEDVKSSVDYIVKYGQSNSELREPSVIARYDKDGELIFIR
ncbi:MAG: L-threonylcarbamoyladenylate synthase [Saprospiraceae bacterium]|nr:L-threonylcarbamoyladenylate synthase [Candidatus Defluviibacterium haderslevense]